jgi:NAD(P)-dependent dehydrogenase (short-subunit alcohol dehydrogenase family)
MSGRVLITGAGGALGRSVVARFLAGGDAVLAVDHTRRSLDALGAELSARPGFSAEALTLQVADLGSSADVEAVFGGAAPPRAVIHLVGGFRFGRLADLGDEDWQALLNLNLDTTFRIVRQCARSFAPAGGGALVAVSSPAALLGMPGIGAYAATKAGVLRLIEAAAREMAPFGGRANSVLPGTMDTPANRASMPDADPAAWVTTEAVAEVIHFLASSAASAVNGAAVPVPGPTL